MINAGVWAGVQSFLDNYVQLRADDTVVLAYTSDSHEAVAWVSVALQLRQVPATRVWMAPLRDVEFRDRLAPALPDRENLPGRLVFLTFELDTLSHDDIIRSELSNYDPDSTVVYRAISACESLFAAALTTTPQELSARNTTILERCMGKRRLHVTTDGGTDLRIEVDSEKHRWISNRGVWRPESFAILPAGEVATYPSFIEGVLVADFAFNLNVMTDVDARLDRRPVTVWIEDSRAVRYACEDEAITRFLDECFGADCAHNVGELGFGTNVGVKSPIALNSHINERHCGIHLGFGESNQPPSVVGYTCKIHLDLIARGARIWIDDSPEPLDLQNITPSSSPHPTRTLDEDANSPGGLVEFETDDCCGILTKDGIKLWRDPYSEGSSRSGPRAPSMRTRRLPRR